MARAGAAVRPPERPAISFGIGVTGHRHAHPLFSENAGQIRDALNEIFDLIDGQISALRRQLDRFAQAPTRLTTLMADGADQAAAELALARGWKLASPLPFGLRLNTAINALPTSSEDALALIDGREAGDPSAQLHARQIEELTAMAAVLDLADQDEKIAQLFVSALDDPQDFAKAQAFAASSAARVAMAGRIVISQSDILVGIWDGVSTASPGGTGHTIEAALATGAPVIWIDPACPDEWCFLQTTEALADLERAKRIDERESILASIVAGVILPDAEYHDVTRAKHGLSALFEAEWNDVSASLTDAYRKIEAVAGGEPRRFRSVKQVYERPDDIAAGSAAGLLDAAHKLPGVDRAQVERIEREALRKFAWADGISARLSDRYRGGMVVNFLLSGLAIVGGILYLPLVDAQHKWPFALFEFLLLLAIVVITWCGVRFRWHGRWFETRRVAEYFRHSPFLLLLGITHAPARSLKGVETSWPEWLVGHSVRGIGLPNATLTSEFLRRYLDLLLEHHVKPQRDYHRAKAKRLKTVHHNLDRLSELLFKLAILSVATYLLLKACAFGGLIDPDLVAQMSKTFTLLGVMFPAFGGAIAGIRFFGDFERFSAISEITYQRLSAIAHRIEQLQAAALPALDYGRVAELALATEDIVVSEIENWQAVFKGKHITVPV